MLMLKGLFYTQSLFAISEEERENLRNWKPMENAHSGHLTGSTGIFAQKLHPLVFQKILEMVKSEISDTSEIKHCLKYYVNTTIAKDLNKKPMAGDRAFYPLNEDIRNHVSKAKIALELSKFDQQNL